MSTGFIAVDWGTTSRRMFLIEDGHVASTLSDDRGASTMKSGDYADEVAAMRARFGDLPMLLAGMVGSDIGWAQVPYVEAPAALPDLAGGLSWVDDRTAIVPGVSFRDAARVDVMRGEEVQMLGAATAGMVPADALLCQPGTHCKWARLKDGAIASFTTAITGELFALVSSGGLLARQLTGAVTLGPAFLAGVAEGALRDIAASLFSIRARGLMGLMDNRDAASFASGLLIGADASARIGAGEHVRILADPELGTLYAAAVEALGGTADLIDSQAAFVAGITRLRNLST